MIVTVTLNPAVDKTVQIDNFMVGAVNRIKARRQDIGGKGVNVAKNIASWGGTCCAVLIAAGSTGEFVERGLKKLGVECRCVVVPGQTRVNLKIVDSVGGTTTDINEPGPQAPAEALRRLEAAVARELRDGDIMVLSGSAAPGIGGDVYANLIEMARGRGAMAIVDADGELLRRAIAAGPYMIKPNIAELERLCGCELTGVDGIIAACRRLLAQYGIGAALVSRGSDGAVYVDAAVCYVLESPRVEACSTVGAGDAMVAAFAYGRARELALPDILREAVAAGAAAVTTDGTQPASAAMVERLRGAVRLREY